MDQPATNSPKKRPPRRRHPKKPNATEGETSHSDSGVGEAAASSSRAKPPRQSQKDASKTSQQPRMAGKRQFGGQLSNKERQEVDLNLSATLNPTATEFTPGDSKPVSKAREKQPAQPPRRSNADTIADRIHEDIANKVYECAICFSELTRRSKIWYCSHCWNVLHLKCAEKWAQDSASTSKPSEQSDTREWRCPGCNLTHEKLPKHYTCWCQKEVSPRVAFNLPPHSCGQTCGKQLLLPKPCEHGCMLQCHAGPCPPCQQIGPVQFCYCGKEKQQKRCAQTETSGWSCQQTCGKMFGCGKHQCDRPCHDGGCGSCKVEIPAKCYCGKVEKTLPCWEFEMNHAGKSEALVHEDGNEKAIDWTGHFDCGQFCERNYDCGKHSCSRKCHPQDLKAKHCPKSPDVVTTCPCGKTPIASLGVTRDACTDPIPNCQETCNKTLSCGHECRQACHDGDCGMCLRSVDISCRCGRTSSKTICHQGEIEPPQCRRACRATLNCGRHDCLERCCPGERKAMDRMASKKKARGPAAEENVEAEHICLRVCGRPLRCGNHNCAELCHKGPCGSCREAIFEEISCSCGRTVLQPPLPCGTKPPNCRADCTRPSPCGHPSVPHNCHPDSESCPKCPFLVSKRCVCGKNILHNQQCWREEVNCWTPCDKTLSCGNHKCREVCHRPDECEDVNGCQQPCSRPKKVCGHPCREKCHGNSPCPDNKPCPQATLITCICQNVKQETRCNASNSGPGNTLKVLPCIEECARLERNRKLALALNVDPNREDDHIPYSKETLNFYMENSTWCAAQEKLLRLFAADDEQRRYRFKPMPSAQREFLHLLAEDFGLDSESMDPEPLRQVVMFKSPRFVMAPMKTLSDCMRISARIASTPASSSIQTPARLTPANAAYNALLLTRPRFGLTAAELENALKPTFKQSMASGWLHELHFQANDEVLITFSGGISDLEKTLLSSKPTVNTLLQKTKLASTVELARADHALNIVRRERVHGLSAGAGPSAGWNEVAARKAGVSRTLPSIKKVGDEGRFVVLGAKKKEAAPVVDDWEAEAEREEQEEGQE